MKTQMLIERLAILLLVIVSCANSKSFVLNISRIVSRPLNVPIESFREWFSLSDIPTRLILLNPGVEKVRVIKGSRQRGLLRPIKFPWTTIKCSIDYDTEFLKGERLTVNCHEDAVSQVFEGSDLFVDAMSKLKVIVAGSADFYINEPADVFSVGVSTRVSFPVPDYFPDAILKSMEKAGSAVLQGKVEYDLGTLLENTFKAHSAWSAEKTLATDLIFVDEKMKYLQKIAV